MALLALLAKEPAHAADLKRTLEQEFGALWPANDGHVYVLLGRLHDAGLVRAEGAGRRKLYVLTAAGHDAVRAWVEEPLEPAPVSTGFLSKVVLAQRAGLGDPLVLLDRQRRAHLRRLREVERLARETGPDRTESLLVEGAALHLQADLRWLERLEQHFTSGGKQS